MSSTPQETIKQCCARLYESDFAKFLLGDSFHPGGLRLTERLGTLLELTPRSRVLDIASGKGASALFIAERFGCEVLGIDYSSRNVAAANAAAVNGRLLMRSTLWAPICSLHCCSRRTLGISTTIFSL